MKVSVIHPKELGAAEQQRWQELQARNPALQSPYFHVAFTRCVGDVRPDARVAVMETQNQVVGFFPYHPGRYGFGTPIGERLSDYHGVVAEPASSWCPKELILACRLQTWDFDHLVAAQAPFRPYHRSLSESPTLDLSQGFEAYLAERRQASKRIPKLIRSARVLERDQGAVRFEASTDASEVFEFVLELKSQQCQRTGSTDYFAWDWTRNLVRRIWETNQDGFSGVLSALWAGDQLAAAHFGMRCGGVLHWWFPVYERDLGRYSPGAVLLLQAAERFAEQGTTLLDLGKGNDAYKSSFQNSAVSLAEGSVERRSIAPLVRAGFRGARARLRSSRLAGPLRRLRTAAQSVLAKR